MARLRRTAGSNTSILGSAYIRRVVLGQNFIPHLPSHPTHTSIPLYPSFCGRHLHAPRQTGSLRRPRHQRCLLPGYAESTCHTLNPLSHLLSLLSSIFSVVVHPRLVPLLSDPVAASWDLRCSPTSSSRDIIQWSRRAVVFRRHRSPFPAGRSRSLETQQGRVVLQEFPIFGTRIPADGTLCLSSPLRALAPG